MNVTLKRRFTTTSAVASQIKPLGLVEIDLTKKTIIVHDGTTAGGVPLAIESHTHSGASSSVAGFMSAADKIKLDALSSAGGYATVDSAGSAVTQRSVLNFSANFSVVDNPGSTRTDVDISAALRDSLQKDMIAFSIIFGN